MVIMRTTILLTLVILFSGCIPGGVEPELAERGTGPFGPSIIFDPLARPTPEIPFPNDIMLTTNPSTQSGASWNVSTLKETDHESHLRELLNKLDGFGPFAPITVSSTVHST